MSRMLDRIKAAQERKASSGGFNSEDNIFFDFTEGVHRVRLVGEWVCCHSHWIAPSKYSTMCFYDEKSFVGEDKLRKNVNCADFDPDTETKTKERTCTICQLRTAANDLLYNCKDSLDKEQEEYLKEIAKAAYPRERYFFLCIDRDSPEVAPGKKGLKIIEFPSTLMDMFFDKASKNADIECCSDEEGVDFILSRKKDGKKTVYGIEYAMKGRSIDTTPLTEEERAYERPDIKKIMCRMPDQARLYDDMLPQYREILDDYRTTNHIEPSAALKGGDREESSSSPALPSRRGATEDVDDSHVPF